MLLAVGWLRFALHLQRSEVQAVLARRGVEIGTGSISRLGDEFLVRFRTWFEEEQHHIAQVMRKELEAGDETGPDEDEAETEQG